MATISPPELERMEAALTSHQDSAYFLELAETYRRSGHLQRAVRVLQRGLENHPTSGAGFALLASVLHEEGRYAEALACWERLLELDPENAEVRRAAAETRARLLNSRGVNGGGIAPLLPDSGPIVRSSPMAQPAAGSDAAHAPVAANAEPSPERAAPAWRLPASPEQYADWSPPSSSTDEVARRSAGPAATPADSGPVKPGVAGTAASSTPPAAEQTPAPEPAPRSGDELMPWERPPDNGGRNGGRADAMPPVPAAPAAAGAPVTPAIPTRAARDGAATSPVRASELEQAERLLRAESPHVDSMAVAIADLLVGLLEYRDPFFRGGTSLTRLLTATIARQMGVEQKTVDEIALGAVLRDLGQLPLKGLISKVGADLTEDAKRQVERHVDTALELLEGVELPPMVRATIRHHHERWDGTGYPDGLAGDAIPLGARIVAVADTFAAMIAARPHRLPKRVPAALEDIRAWSGTCYDPAVVDALMRAVATPTWRGIGFGLRHHLILVDPDETRAMVLATRLCSHGYLAEASFSADSALERMMRSRISGLIVSADLPDDEATRLLREVRDTTRLGMIPIIMTEAGVTQRVPLLDAGADVCLTRGSSFEELKATFEAFLRREGKTTANGASKSTDASWTGLQGDIEDFPLSWLLQVLNYDARTAAVFIEGDDDEGAIYLDKGHPRHAQTRTLVGEAAFRSMVRWSAGSFSVDPEARTDDCTIRTPLMNLLLDQAVQEDHAAFFGSVRPEP